ncbi:LT_GEWL domain containing protein [uncultured Caudovirales phage]|uniref:LT_GEWL domain containing protein n=1 Tax=uncultured Caudovirales phage TaxID=2100421 RepID=A0A6J5LYR9_9CAUD|nr:LT_GEWL domain containing protein [uncultured Caudovirales phage]CAB4218835.1 LT_GEWL domain containing protein [uncultured Caudovirales phage]
MENAPNSYKDPYWENLSSAAEKKVGLPGGLLNKILTLGERSNADQVSEAKAKTPYQIIPETRDAFLKKYGVDAYLSPENSAEVAALVLKEGLDRNKGNIAQAVGEYHAGPNRNKWGPRTKAYIARVMNSKTENPEQLKNENLSTFDKELAKQETKSSKPSIDSIYDAYISDKMTDQEDAEFESDVNNGLIILRPGAKLKKNKPNTTTNVKSGDLKNNTQESSQNNEEFSLAQRLNIYNAYKSGAMPQNEKEEFKADVKSGVFKLPEGASLEPDQKTTAAGLAGAATRGLALPAAGAALGAVAGAPFGGVGAIPGAIAGAGAATLAEVVADPAVALVNNLFGTNYNMPTEALNELLTKAGIAQPKTDVERLVQSAAAGAGGAGGVTLAGRAIQSAAGASAPITRGIGRALAAQPAAQIAGGAASGASGQLAQESGFGPVGQIAASLAGGVAGAKAGGAIGARMGTQKMAPTAAAKVPINPDLAAAERAGVRLMTSDVLPPRTFVGKTAQSMGERIPIAGTGGERKAQQTDRINAVRNILDDYGAHDVSKLSEDVFNDLSAKRSSDIKKYSDVKQEVINRLSDKGTVQTPKAIEALDKEIAELSSRNNEVANEAREKLIEIRNDFKDSRNLFELEAYRQDVLSKAFNKKDIDIAIKDVGEKALRSIYDPLRKDMGNFIKANGERRDFNKWAVANKRLSTTADDLKNASLKTVLAKGNVTPEIVQKLLFSNKPSEVKVLYSKLTPQGRSNARSAILAKAAKDATVNVAEGSDVVSPDRFSNSVKKLGDSVGVFFSGDDLKRVEGLTRVLNITKRASEAAAAPTTGAQAVPFVTGGLLASLFGPVGAVGSAATIGGLSRVYESPQVRNLLLKIPKTKTGSKEESAIAKRILSAMQMQQKILNESGKSDKNNNKF